MKTATRAAIAAVSIPLLITGCLNNNPVVQQGSVMVSDVVSICGAIVGGQAEQRINQEWAKYPEAEASRPIIETMANVLLTNPEGSEQMNASAYKKYITCAAGLLATNQVVK
ncbi:MAG: hypothetical protein KAT12_03340 [Gammaproteobacteria bacterium]|nr:hypothetical protein [Gammaproteobacteria bacterium]